MKGGGKSTRLSAGWFFIESPGSVVKKLKVSLNLTLKHSCVRCRNPKKLKVFFGIVSKESR